MPRAERNRNLFASAIAGSMSSGSTTSRRTRLGTNPSEPYLVEEERATTTTRTETNIKKRLKNIELLTEINNDPDFSKDVINRVAKNIFKANIFSSTKDLVDETEHNKNKIAGKTSGMRGGIASRVKSAIFEIFGESQLSRIDFQSFPAEINSWKLDQRVRHAYRKLFNIFSEDRTYVRRQHFQEGWRERRQCSEEEESDTTGGDTERAEIVAKQ
ncbi:hypothetical protein Glove_585g30 [Diversispora epigaea]|uniref:Uncharacterized protein n=1 Tax=Diversispora epigaea TaxID=1348612 RepID=A0A397GBU1_9GLOM|nr:hypothetical protein Glove_585g30 [Diversispora epigaea]